MGLLGRKGKEGRPPLKEPPRAGSADSLDDALVARETGRRDEARALLRTLDRGKGLRTVLRAAAALEAGDEEELEPLLPAVSGAEPPWLLALQVASSLDEVSPDVSARLLELARQRGAPPWALAWAAATAADNGQKRRGMVDLLFADAALARTVAGRDWKLEGAADDRNAVERYAILAHGRDVVSRFGAVAVAAVVARAAGWRPDTEVSGRHP